MLNPTHVSVRCAGISAHAGVWGVFCFVQGFLSLHAYHDGEEEFSDSVVEDMAASGGHTELVGVPLSAPCLHGRQLRGRADAHEGTFLGACFLKSSCVVSAALQDIFSKVDKSGEGVCVQASTLGSLEALLSFLDSGGHLFACCCIILLSCWAARL